MKNIVIVVFVLLGSFCFMAAQTLSGSWIPHPFPSSQSSLPIIRCGNTVGIFSDNNTGTIAFFDANNGAWIDKKINSNDYIIESCAKGNAAFAYTNDSLLLAYSSIEHSLDSIKFYGRPLGNPQLWSCGENLAAFATKEYFYVFDATDGLWHSLGITLPTFSSFQSAKFVLGTDYVLLIIYRNLGDPPKHYVYSLNQHSFNQLEYGPLPNEMMNHGYAGSITASYNSKNLIGYSSITNQYSIIEVPFGLGNHEEMGPHHWGGSIYAYIYSYEVVPNYHWKTHFCVYSTLIGQWSCDVFDYSPSIGYGGLHVGAEYAQVTKNEEIALNLFFSNPLVWSSYTGVFQQFFPNFKTVSGVIYPPSANILGKKVLGIIHSDTAWGYNAITNLSNTCSIEGTINSINSNIFEGNDYIAFGRYETYKDSMDIYIFDGNQWHHLICGNNGGGTSNFSTDELYAIYSFYQHSYKVEIIVYSKELGYTIRIPLPYQSYFLGAFAKGCLFEINTTNGSFIFDSQTLIPHQFGFQIYSDWISDSIAVLYDNTSHQIFGYSAKTKSWANFNTTANINFNDVETNVGLLTAGYNREKVYAYNGIHGTWVPLIPEGKSIAYDAGDNFAVVFKEGMAYAFFTERNGPAIISTILTSNASSGNQTIEVYSTYGFSVGDSIVINPGGPNEELNKIFGFGSIQLQTPLQFDHFVGERVQKLNITSVEEKKENIFTRFELFQNYPNPFNPSTTINWQSPVSSWQTIKLYDLMGREVETIAEGYYEAGSHSKLYIVNSSLPSGVYFYQLKAGDYIQTRKMLLLK